MPSPASGKTVEMIIPSEVRDEERQVSDDITSGYKLKTDTNELIAWRHRLPDLEKKTSGHQI